MEQPQYIMGRCTLILFALFGAVWASDMELHSKNGVDRLVPEFSEFFSILPYIDKMYIKTSESNSSKDENLHC